MGLLIFYLFLALGISFLCSILESVLLSIPQAFIAALEKKNPPKGKELNKLKQDIDRPLAAILSLNTISHTVGAAGVGAQAMIIFGETYIAVISAILTILILVFSEIIPKTLGVIYWRKLSLATVSILKVMIILLYPFVVLAQKITKLISRKRDVHSVNREEINALFDVGFKEGTILKQETHIAKNLLQFGSLKAKDIMTPRPVIFSLPENFTTKEYSENYESLQFTRILLYKDSIDKINYYVRKDDILNELAKQRHDTPLFNLRREIVIVPGSISLFQLFEDLVKKREHIALVVDEYGGVSGLVTLEDLVETLIGIEIIDETDIAADMQKLAKREWLLKAKKLGIDPDK